MDYETAVNHGYPIIDTADGPTFLLPKDMFLDDLLEAVANGVYGAWEELTTRPEYKEAKDAVIEKADSYTPTSGMKTAAERALRWKKEGKATGAGTPVGWGRASDIVAGRSMSLDVVKRMYSFFSRHEVDKQGKDFDNISNPSNGRIMWDAWGGDSGFSWSRGIVERTKDDVAKFRADQARNRMGQFAPEGVGGGGNEPPYDLKNDPNGWEMSKHGDAYEPNLVELKGPDAPVLGKGYGGTHERRFTNQLAEIAYKSAHPEEAANQDALEEAIRKDPRYPKSPVPEITSEMLKAAGYGDDFDKLSNYRQHEVKIQAVKEMAGEELRWDEKPLGIKADPERLKSYLEEENKAVKTILREQKFADGKSVGFAVDDIAHQAIKQLQAEVADGTVSLTMPKGRLRKFMADEEYKSGHEVPLEAKGGATRQAYLDVRDQYELGVMGIPRNAAKPIYAVLNRTKDEQNYGEIQLVLKGSIASRTSITVGDSLDGHAGGSTWAADWAKGDMSVSQFYSLYGKHTGTLLGNGNRSAKGIYETTSSAKFPVQMGVSDSMFTWELEPPIIIDGVVRGYSPKWGAITGYTGVKDVRTWAESSYLEAQVHGRVKMSDVAKIVVPPTFSMTKAEVQSLTDAGIELVKGEHILGKDK